jgi:uncharacterized protein YpbB
MALNWNVERVHDYENLCWIPELNDDGTQQKVKGEPVSRVNPLTENIIFNTMHVGISRITEDNAETFHERLQELQKVGLASELHSYDEAAQGWLRRIPTLAEIKAHIGLSTNAARITKRSFGAKIRKEQKLMDKEREVWPEGYTPKARRAR